jgi:predicted transposase YbfD/YdcC
MALTVIEGFSDMEDPRIDRQKLYPLIEIVFLTIAAVVSGSDHFTEIQIFGNANLKWLRRFLPFANGIPSHDAIGYFFSKLDPEQFKEKFVQWIQSVATVSNGEIVAIDGKTLRGSQEKSANKQAIHMISAWARNAHLVLGQRKVESKSNEITAIPELLKMLELAGCIVTIDAMGCQKKVAKAIVKKKADYVLAVKGNQGSLHEQIKTFFEDQVERDFEDYRNKPELLGSYETIERDHGRVDVRKYWITSDIGWLEEKKDWKSLAAIGCARLTSTTGEKTICDERYYIEALSKIHQRDGSRQIRRSGTWPLGNREQPALVTRCKFSRRRIANTKRSDPGQLRRDPTHLHEHAETRDNAQARHQGETLPISNGFPIPRTGAFRTFLMRLP